MLENIIKMFEENY